MGTYRDLLLPDSRRTVHLTSRTLVRIEGGSTSHGWLVPGLVAWCNSYRQPLHLCRTSHVQRMGYLGMLGRVPRYLPDFNVSDVRHGEMVGTCNRIVNSYERISKRRI